MKKFLISDFDGTFYIDDESIKHNIDKVKEFRNKGNLFAIATGRSLYDFTKKLEKFNIEYDYLIINHGATLLDGKHQLIKNYPIDNKAMKDIKCEFNLIDNQNIFACKCLESRVSINKEDITKVQIKCSSEEERVKFSSILNTKYKSFVKNYLITNLDDCIEIISSDTDKSIAIEEVAKIENIAPNNVFTVGDSFNDLEMLEAFNGFCMNTSEELVKSKISKNCTTVAELIDKIIGGTNE